MVTKIIISHLNNIAAIIHNSKIQELIIKRDTYQVNDIYIGIVQKIFTSINAAFIKLNYTRRSGFIHISDTKYLYSSKNSNIYSVSDVLSLKQQLLVQIIKEPTTTKGPRLTTNIHLSGQYVTLMPFNNTICIEQSIYDENERSFLRALGTLVKPFKMGILFKETSVGIDERILIKDLRALSHKWNFIEKSAITASGPKLLHYDSSIIQTVLRDYFNQETSTIIADCKNSLKQIHEHLGNHNITTQRPRLSIQLYNNRTCILEKFGINSVIFDILKSKVELASGIYLVIESSEALTTIDVNSGSFHPDQNNHDSLLQTNCLAATEIGHQIRIRNLNGIIIIDFIDMKSHQDQLRLLEHFNKVLLYDEAKPEIIQLSELGLVELTRRRRGQSITEVFGKLNSEQITIHSYSNQVTRMTSNSDQYLTNVHSVFFKRKFSHLEQMSSTQNKKQILKTLKHQYIIPLNLYYFSIDKHVEYN
uniref:Ribonuclease E n=1 Tax=Izziella formosana TaxID=1653389 RepID=A0A1G4NUF9_9FLOR|nr:Ribonuclease E [Izziella formosana]SCW22277.1 Ribonuclease E [Izziella formosana]